MVSTSRGFKEAGVLPPRRVYTDVAVEAEAGGFAVRLDGRTARTPAGGALRLPARALAELSAEEWAGQGEVIAFPQMPATRLAFTALDRLPGHREAVADEVARYAGTDLLCYRSEDPALAAEEAAVWDPVLRWAEETLGLRLVLAEGIAPVRQPPEVGDTVRRLGLALDDAALAGLAHGAALYGSAVLALALQRGRLGGVEAFALSRLDESWQEGRWGVDAEAAERTAAMMNESLLLERWFRAAAGEAGGG